MKAEHRHELKTNELADWIVNFPQWTRQNATTIIYVSVLVVLVAAAYFWKVYEKRILADKDRFDFTSLVLQVTDGKIKILQDQAQGVDTSYILIQAADSLQKVAQNTKSEQMAALALIKEAEALRVELHYRFGSISSTDLTAQINRAKNCYEDAIKKPSANPSSTASAKLGLGLCEEELGNFEKARQIYEEIIANPDFESTIAASGATLRLNTMADYQQKVFIRPSPPTQEPAELIPQIRLQNPQGFPTQGKTSGNAP